ncbi:hypothetical protein FQZ97_769870 [compost metagenome]
MNGSLRHSRLHSSVTASVTAATAAADQLMVSACSARWRSTPKALVPVGTCSPNTSFSAYSPISVAAPQVKPSSTDGEIKLASEPSRSVPTASCITPTTMVTASASPIYAGLPANASGLSMANNASELALVGPDITCQLEPNSAATIQGTTAL